jgi:hypothetical protein
VLEKRLGAKLGMETICRALPVYCIANKVVQLHTDVDSDKKFSLDVTSVWSTSSQIQVKMEFAQ